MVRTDFRKQAGTSLILSLLVVILVVGCTQPQTTREPQGLGQRSEMTNTPRPSNTPSPTITNTPTKIPTNTPDWTATPGPSPTASKTPTITPTPTATKRPTRTRRPTRTPTPERQLVPALGDTSISVQPGAPTPGVPIPTVVPTIAVPPKTTNILLLGNDDEVMGEGVTRTDSIIVVSVNRERNTASLISIPRDLYVYVPDWTMNKINTAAPFGGVSRLKETILYNFGIPIHYHARVNFGAFTGIVDALGGIEVGVSCELEDWRLKAPGLDIFEEDNYERFTLPVGIHQMDGDLALWYARSRKTTSDFDRGRRQQQILRAILDQAVDGNLLLEVPKLWSVYNETVETDLDIGRILQFAAAAPDIRDTGVQSIYLAGDNVTSLSLESPDGPISVQLPNEIAVRQSFERLYQPPALNRANRPPLTVEIINGNSNPDMVRLAAENLAWQGFVPIISDESSGRVRLTSATFNAANLRGSYDWLMTWIFDLKRPAAKGNGAYQGDGEYGIELDPESESPYNYRLVLGQDYDPCRPELFAPKPFQQ